MLPTAIYGEGVLPIQRYGMITKICKCGQQFTTSRDHTLCTGCRKLSKPKIEQICENCGRTYWSKERRPICPSCRGHIRYHHNEQTRRDKLNSDPIYRAEYLAKKRGYAAIRRQSGVTKSRIESTPRLWLGHKLSVLRHRCIHRSGSHKRNYWKPHAIDLSIEHLLNMWREQEGRCALTHLPLTTKFGDMYSASIDRCDSMGEYTPDNVQLVGLSANLAKREYSNHAFGEWLAQIRIPTIPIRVPANDYLRELYDRIVHRRRWGHDRLDEGVDISIDYLRNLWERQGGKCALTSIALIDDTHNLMAASVDRIDSTRGYSHNNIHLVCAAINYAKNCRPLSDAVEWVNAIRTITSSDSGGI